jgi:hypothetical protein
LRTAEHGGFLGSGSHITAYPTLVAIEDGITIEAVCLNAEGCEEEDIGHFDKLHIYGWQDSLFYLD